MTVRKATPAEKANAARLRDLKHVLDAIIKRPVREGTDSISVGRNSGGRPVFDVKFYARDGETTEQHEDRLMATVDRLAARYPLETGYLWAKDNGA